MELEEEEQVVPDQTAEDSCDVLCPSYAFTFREEQHLFSDILDCYDSLKLSFLSVAFLLFLAEALSPFLHS
jgi:hypothetical protein